MVVHNGEIYAESRLPKIWRSINREARQSMWEMLRAACYSILDPNLGQRESCH